MALGLSGEFQFQQACMGTGCIVVTDYGYIYLTEQNTRVWPYVIQAYVVGGPRISCSIP